MAKSIKKLCARVKDLKMQTIPGVSILAPVPQQFSDILSIPAQEFLATLQRYAPPSIESQNLQWDEKGITEEEIR